jgi:hypothetical protein
MGKKRISEADLLKDLDGYGAHADERAEPTSNELEPLDRLKGSVKRYERPTDPAADPTEWGVLHESHNQGWEDWLGGVLGAVDTDSVGRLCRICVLAEELFHGDRQAAKQWLQSPAYAFKEESPIDRAMTEEGSQEVETLIGRIRHGIPT